MMRGEIFKYKNVILATFFSVVLIGGAYWLAKGIDSPQMAQASSETALLQAIATKDSDGDGLPDWEETLYGTDSHVVDTFHLGMTDGEAVTKGLIVPKAIADVAIATSTAAMPDATYAAYGLPAPTGGTLTDSFAKAFFAAYLAAKRANGGAELTSDQVNTLATDTMGQLTKNVTPTTDFKSATDIKVSGTGADALRSFAVAAETVLKSNTTDATMSDLAYMQAAVDGDSDAANHLASLAKSYRGSAAGIAILPVPKELAADDLAIVNSLMRLANIYGDLARVGADPLTAMLSLQQYRQAELAAEGAFTHVASVYAASGVTIANGTPGASFVNVMVNIGAEQAAP